MKRRIVAAAFVASALYAAHANASEWGCKLLLCFSNPEGWQTIPDCWPPVEAYLACSSVWFFPCSMPTCPEAGENDTPSWNRLEQKLYRIEHDKTLPALG